MGRAINGMTREPIWKGKIKVKDKILDVKIYRLFRNKLTGKNIYFAETEYDGEKIYLEDDEMSRDVLLPLLKEHLTKKSARKSVVSD